MTVRVPWRRTPGAVLSTVVLIVCSGLALSCARGPGASAGADRALAAAIAEVEAGRRTTPLIDQPAPGEDAAVTFLVRTTDGQAPRIVSDVTGWGERTDDETFDLTIGAMTRLGSTDWYRLDTQVAPRARVEYLVVHGQTDYRVDPSNPRRAWTRGTGPISELVTPDYVPPPELTDPPATPTGTTVEATLDIPALGRPRRVIVYLPPGYRDDGAYPVAVFHAGWRVATEGRAPQILDWLIAHREIEPIVGMFLESYVPGDSGNHEGEPMRTFLTREAPEWLRSRYGVSARSNQWAVLAISYGAKDALDAALAPAGTYGRLGLLIPGRRITSADLEGFARQRDRRLRVSILAGRYDQANLATARAVREMLSEAGHDVDFIEVPEGHNPTTWRDHLRDVLASLFGGREDGGKGVEGSFAKVAGPTTGGQVALKDQLVKALADVGREVGTEQGGATLTGETISLDHRVTNISRREDGAWKIVPHHTDASPAMVDLALPCRVDRISEGTPALARSNHQTSVAAGDALQEKRFG